MRKKKKLERKGPKANQRVTMYDIYLRYPHKWKDVHSNTVPKPYFPNEEITNNRFSLSYKEWRNIMNELVKEYADLLLSGKKLDPKKAMGYFQLHRYKPARPNLDFKHYRETGEKRYEKNPHTDGFCPLIVWNRSYKTKAKLKYKSYWKISFTDMIWKIISRRLLKDGNYIYNFDEI